jgi:CRP/FNR family cyclic AMP-dependent transcriptional regulator
MFQTDGIKKPSHKKTEYREHWKADMKANQCEMTQHPFLKDMSPEHVKVLQECSMRCHFDAGELIFQEGEIANRFYLIQKGKIALVSKNEAQSQQIQVIGAGDVLGWSWLFPPYTWYFDARAVEATEAIFLYGTRLREACESDPGLGYDLMQRMSKVIIERLQATRRQLIECKLGRRNYIREADAYRTALSSKA